MTKIFDFNIHPRLDVTNNSRININNELNASPKIIQNSFINFINTYKNKHNIIGYNFMIFSSFFDNKLDYLEKFYESLNKQLIKSNLFFSFTHLVNPNLSNSKDFLIKLKSLGVKFIKFHSYHQQIDCSKYKKCIQIAKIAEDLNMGICIDASFGTKYLFKYNNLELASEILINVKKVPVIILHLGGFRSVEAALLIQDTPNGYLETSFSPHFYRGLNTYSFFIDALKIIKSERILHASDYPYIDLESSIKTTKHLIKKSNLLEEDSDNILWKNSLKLIKER